MSRLAAWLPLFFVVVLSCGVLPVFANPTAETSRTCSEYSNQREAQLNKDTIDRDYDGIYCESLPCPCLKPGSTYRPPATRKPVLFNGRCKRGKLPDFHCTPGSAFRNVTADEVCTTGYSKRVRNVPESLKR